MKIPCNAPCGYLIDGECGHIKYWEAIIDPWHPRSRPSIVEQKRNVLKLVLSIHGELSRDQIVELSKFPRSSVYDMLQVLVRREVVIEKHERRKPTGRPTTIYKLNQDMLSER